MANIINFYEKIPKKDLLQQINPHFNVHHIKLPFRMLVIGSSGSGKTNFAINLIKMMSGTFNSLTIITRNADEALYNMLKKKLKNDVQICEGLSNIPNLDDFDKKDQHLVIFDDLINVKNQNIIQEYYLRCRKLNISVMYLSQSYFKIPMLIRQNANYIIIIKVSSTKDLTRMLREYDCGVTKEMMIELYKHATKKKFGFLMLDCDAEPENKFYIDFKHVNVQTDV